VRREEMSRSQRHPRETVDKFCREFYDKNILQHIVSDTNFSALFSDMVREAVIQVDPYFTAVDPESFESEMKVLRFEMFSLAWLHEVGGEKSGDQFVVAQSEFTRRYLEEKGRLDIWETMEPYNQAIAQSSALGNKVIDLAQLDRERFLKCSHWYMQGIEPKCAIRAANRLFTEKAWERRITAGLLMAALCDQLRCEINKEARFRLMSVIIGLYEGSKTAIHEVDVG
jgi:hypothetical protein